MPPIIEGKLSLSFGTGRNLFVLNPISTCSASVIVDPEEAKNLTEEDIGKHYFFCEKSVQVGISKFNYAYLLKEITTKKP